MIYINFNPCEPAIVGPIVETACLCHREGLVIGHGKGRAKRTEATV